MNKPQIDRNGTKRWFNQKDQLHREDGPAVEYADGTKRWFQQGKFHRDDGPSIEYNNGDKFWYQHDQLHREDGPAVEYTNGYQEWWIKGEQLKFSSQEEFERYMKLKAFW